MNTPTPATSPPRIRRVIVLLLLNTAVVWGFHLLQRRFSGFDEQRGAYTTIPVPVDLVVIWVAMLLNAALVWRWRMPVQLTPQTATRAARIWARLKGALALLVVAVLCATFYEFYARANDTAFLNASWSQVIDDDAFFYGFALQRDNAPTIANYVAWRNFTPRGIALSFWALAGTLRELNWWWGIVPLRDARYEDWQAVWPNLIAVNAVLALLIYVCGRALMLIGAYGRLLYFKLRAASRWLLRLPYLNRMRWGRLRAHLPLVGLVCVLVLHGFITYVNANAPSLSAQVETIGLVKGPITWPAVNTLVSLDNVLYAGTEGGGVFRSKDSGTNWEAVSNGLSSINVQSLLISGTLLYAGTRAGVFRSSDGGASWQEARTGLNSQSINSLLSDGKNLFAGTVSGVFRSSNGGTNWQAISEGLGSRNVQSLLLVSDTAVYVGATRVTHSGTINGVSIEETFEGGIFRSSDGGVSWQSVNAGLSNTHVESLVVSGTVLYAGTWDGVFRSSDDGVSWQSVSAGLSNINVESLVVSGTVLYAGTWDGVFRSSDGGVSWQALNTGLSNDNVESLLVSGTVLYVGTTGGVFRSSNDGSSWQSVSVGLTDIDVQSLVIRNKEIYVGTRNGIFRSVDGGVSWDGASVGLTATSIRSLVVSGTVLYAGTWDGVFRSSDDGVSWQSANTGLGNTNVWSLVISGTVLYAETRVGVFHSSDGGQSWQTASEVLSNIPIRSLLVNGTLLYARSWDGVFRSSDGGATWQFANTGLGNTNVWSLVISGTVLYAGTEDGVFRSSDSGQSWQIASVGLSHTIVKSLVVDGAKLYAGTEGGGLFRSSDGGQSWQAASAGLSHTIIQSLLADGAEMFAETQKGTYRSKNLGATWEQVHPNEQAFPVRTAASDSLAFRWDTSSSIRFGITNSELRNSLGRLGVNTVDPAELWTWLPDDILPTLPNAATTPNRKPIALVWGNTIQLAQLKSSISTQPEWIVVVRALSHGLNIYAEANPRNIIFFGAAILGLIFLAYSWVHRQRPDSVQTRVFSHHGAAWLKLVRSELVLFGDARPTDLQAVPAHFRRAALAHYAESYQETQLIEAKPNHIRLQAPDRVYRWQVAWTRASRALGKPFTPRTRAVIETLCQSLAQTLGLTILDQHEYQQARVYRVEAPALRLNVPPRFPLVFLSVAQPTPDTVKLLVDAMEVAKESSYFALVVPLAPAGSLLDVASELRRAIAQSPYVHDFIVLDNDDLLDLLIARQPTDALAQRILAQADLATVSPFQAEGPVNEAMFFGREAEVKTLMEQTLSGDFAVVGNRKIGKTSLLKRAVARLQDDPRSLPLFINCQEVREADEFYTEFVRTTQMELTERTPDGFRAAIAQLGQSGRLPVLFLDEVDRLLNHERDHGERLVGKWRTMSQEGLCHFAFFGSTGLARRQDDPQSSFFNFAQQIALGYLDRKTADMVLREPLTTLGLELEEAEVFLSDAFAVTSGHPNLTQFIGRGLVNAVNERKERLIRREDLTALLASSAFEDFYLKTIWGEAGPLEKLITLVALVASDEGGFSFAALSKALADEGVQADENAVAAALKMLGVYSILRREGRSYRFIPRAFQTILHRSQDVDRLIRQERARLITPPTANSQ